MALDKIPQVKLGLIEANYFHRHRSFEELERFQVETVDYLRENRYLGNLINNLAQKSQDPASVYRAVFTILDVVNAQMEVDELNKTSKLKNRKRKK